MHSKCVLKISTWCFKVILLRQKINIQELLFLWRHHLLLKSTLFCPFLYLLSMNWFESHKYGITWLEVLLVFNLHQITIKVFAFNKKCEKNKVTLLPVCNLHQITILLLYSIRNMSKIKKQKHCLLKNENAPSKYFFTPLW